MLNRIKIYNILDQVYVLPFVKFTYHRRLNGYVEFIIGWLNKEIVISLY